MKTELKEIKIGYYIKILTEKNINVSIYTDTYDNLLSELKKYKNYKLHCENGPAWRKIEPLDLEKNDTEKRFMISDSYYVNGELHRLDGPARTAYLINSDWANLSVNESNYISLTDDLEFNKYYINGQEIFDKDTYNEILFKLKLELVK